MHSLFFYHFCSTTTSMGVGAKITVCSALLCTPSSFWNQFPVDGAYYLYGYDDRQQFYRFNASLCICSFLFSLCSVYSLLHCNLLFRLKTHLFHKSSSSGLHHRLLPIRLPLRTQDLVVVFFLFCVCQFSICFV